MGTFKERIQWVGDPRWKDGSIVIHNLDYTDNGTFTCDVKNPPDIVGKTSQVTLYVFEKGVRGGRPGARAGRARARRVPARLTAFAPAQCPRGPGWCWAPSSGASWARRCCCCCSST